MPKAGSTGPTVPVTVPMPGAQPGAQLPMSPLLQQPAPPPAPPMPMAPMPQVPVQMPPPPPQQPASQEQPFVSEQQQYAPPPPPGLPPMPQAPVQMPVPPAPPMAANIPPAPPQQYAPPQQQYAPPEFQQPRTPSTVLPGWQGAPQGAAPPGVPGDVSAAMTAMMSGATGSPDNAAAILGSFNLANIQDTSFRILPLDVSYEGEVKKVELTRSNAGAHMLKITIQTTHPGPHRGVTIIDYLPLMDTTMWRYKSFLRATEQLAPDGHTVITQSLKDFEGYIVAFNIRHDEYEGQLRNKINGGYDVGTMSAELHAQPAQPGAPTWAPPAG